MFVEGTTLFFTLNGSQVEESRKSEFDLSNSYPAFCLTCQNDQVRIVQSTFKFDLKAYLDGQRYQQLSEVKKLAPVSDVESLVVDYLKHLGYSDTLESMLRPAKA